MVTVMNVSNVNSAKSTATFGQSDRDFVVAVARRIVDPEAAEDVAQDAMLLAYRYRGDFRGDSQYRTWLYRIAATTAFGYLRRCRRSREQLATDQFQHDTVDPARSPEVLLSDLQVAAAACALLDQLAPKYRDVVVLRTELTEAAVAARLGITVANVKVRAHRARAQLRIAFERAPAARAA
jgi:RNA polymerase sigma-70 factor (ECF subfamily)